MKKWIGLLLILVLIGCAKNSKEEVEVVETPKVEITNKIILKSKQVSYVTNYEYTLSQIVKLPYHVELVNPEEIIMFEKEGEIEILVSVICDDEPMELSLIVEVEDRPAYLIIDYKQRNYYVDEIIDPYAGVKFGNKKLTYIGQQTSFSKVGTYYLDYRVTGEVQETIITAPIYIIYSPDQEDYISFEDEIDQFLLPFLNSYLNIIEASSEFIDSDKAALNASVKFMLWNEQNEKDGYNFVFPHDQLEEISWTYYNYKLPEKYCDWLSYDEINDTCYDTIEFGFLGGDAPAIETTFHFREEKWDGDYQIISYIMKKHFPTEEYSEYIQVICKLINEDGQYRIVEFDFGNPAD